MKYIRVVSIILLCFFMVRCAEKHQVSVTSLLDVLQESWEKRDASQSAVISTALIELLVITPEKTMKFLVKNGDITSELMRRMQYDVFTDYSGKDKEQLRILKENAIYALKKCACKNKEESDARDDLINVLNRIEIRSID